MTRLSAILHFRHKFPDHGTCVIVAEHRGSYSAVVKDSKEHTKHLDNPNNTCVETSVKGYLREQLRNQGYPENYIRYVIRTVPL